MGRDGSSLPSKGNSSQGSGVRKEAHWYSSIFGFLTLRSEVGDEKMLKKKSENPGSTIIHIKQKKKTINH